MPGVKKCEGCGVEIVGTRAKRFCKSCLNERHKQACRDLREREKAGTVERRTTCVKCGAPLEPGQRWRCKACAGKIRKIQKAETKGKTLDEIAKMAHERHTTYGKLVAQIEGAPEGRKA